MFKPNQEIRSAAFNTATEGVNSGEMTQALFDSLAGFAVVLSVQGAAKDVTVRRVANMLPEGCDIHVAHNIVEMIF